MNLEDKRQACITFVKRLDTADFSGLPIAADFTAWTPVNGEIEFAKYAAAAKTVASVAAEDMVFTIDGTAAEGDRIAVEASCRARVKTGKVYDQHYHFVFLFKNNLIHRLRTHLDTKMVVETILPALADVGTGGLSLKKD